MLCKVTVEGVWNEKPLVQNFYFDSEEEGKDFTEGAVGFLSKDCIVPEDGNCTQIHGPKTALKITTLPADAGEIEEDMDMWSSFYHFRDEYYIEVITDLVDEKTISYLYEAKGNHRKVPLIAFGSDEVEPAQVMFLSMEEAERAIEDLQAFDDENPVQPEKTVVPFHRPEPKDEQEE